MKTELYGGKVVVTTTFRSYASDADARRILALVKGSVPLMPDEETEVSVTSLVFANTTDIKFDLEGASDEIISWSKYWLWLNTYLILDRDEDGGIVSLASDAEAGMQTWFKYRRMIGNTVAADWYKAFEKAQNIYPAAAEMAKIANIPAELANDADFLGDGSAEEKTSETVVTPTS